MLWFMELTPWSGVTLRRLRYLINSPHFVESGSNYHVLKRPLIVPDFRHLNPTQCLPSHFFEVHFIIALQSTPTPLIGFLPSGFPIKICAFIVSSSLPCTLPITKSYRVADKSLARPGKKQATATENFEFHISYL